MISPLEIPKDTNLAWLQHKITLSWKDIYTPKESYICNLSYKVNYIHHRQQQDCTVVSQKDDTCCWVRSHLSGPNPNGGCLSETLIKLMSVFFMSWLSV